MLPLAHFCLTPLHLAAHVADPPPLAGPRAAAARPVVCVDPTTLARRDDVSGSFTETRETEHFLLAWDPANSAVTEAATRLPACARLTGMPPSQRITPRKGGLNSCSLPIQYTFRRSANATIRV